MTHKIAILGASGYTGAELIRLLSDHKKMEITTLIANVNSGKPISSVFPHLRHLDLPNTINLEQADFSYTDLCFCALPHEASQEIVSKLPEGLKIVDLSADFRIRDPSDYEFWYKTKHKAKNKQKTAVYGLTEFYREKIRRATLVAGTGCNAAIGQYILRPLIAERAIELDNIIIDMKCAVSGAGRKLIQNLLHSEISEGYSAYSVGGIHRHLAEFDQELSELAGQSVKIQFTPHLIPANRGILATAYVIGNPRIIFDILREFYGEEPFIVTLPFGETPSTHHVRGSNYCHIGVAGDRIDNRTIIVGALDNLTKGSSGQALQNANLMLGEDETSGLTMAPIFP